MNKSKRKNLIVASVMAVLLAVIFTGCAQNSGQPKAQETAAASAVAETQAVTQAPAQAETEAPAQAQQGSKARPFTPEEIHDLSSAEAIGDFGSVKVMDMYKLRDIESLLKDAKKLEGWPNCPYDMVIRLTRNDGEVFEFQPATDDCGNLLSGGNDWYSFSKYGNKRLFDVFDLTPVTGKVIKREALPKYTYNGDNGIIKAATEYFLKEALYKMPKGSAAVPEFTIVKVEEDADGNVKLYGNFWMTVYTKKDRVLVLESGGSSPGVLYLKKTGDNAYEVVKYDEAGTGDDMDKDIKRFCNGDKKLKDRYYEAGNVSNDRHKAWKNWFLYNYVKDNKLDVAYTQGFNESPVEITPTDKMPEIE